MLDCLILGDSIAVGTHQFRQECKLVGKGGINTWQFNKYYAYKIETAETVIISLGSNDHSGVNSFKELLSMRQQVDSKRVLWILPAGNLKASGIDIESIQDMIRIIARNYKDTVLTIPDLSKDKIHPTHKGYKSLAEQTK